MSNFTQRLGIPNALEESELNLEIIIRFYYS